jgi:hypothetical protein
MSSEILEIQQSLERGFFKLNLPTNLEKAFRKELTNSAAGSFKTNSAILSVAFLIILAITASVLDAKLLELWPIACGVIFSCLVVVSVLVRIAWLDKYYQFYTGLLASIALTASSAIPYFMKGELMIEITLIASIYCIVIVYTMTKLLFFNAVVWCLLSVVFTLIVLDYFSASFSWLTFHIHITVGHIFGITLAYIMEHREKNLFLSNRLMRLEKVELNKIRKVAERQSLLQAKISKFLESLSSDQSLSSLGVNILKEMSTHIVFNVASIYYLKGNTLIRFGSYALSDQSNKRKSYELNETLLGASIINNKIKILSEFPADSLAIGSGIGNADVCSLLHMPIQFEGNAIGGLELGAFKPFSDLDLELLEGIKLGLGITLSSCKSKDSTIH